MAESTLTTAYADLRKEIGRHLGMNPDPAAPWSAQEIDDVKYILERACRQVAVPPAIEGYHHRWSFLDQPWYQTTDAPYKTGTIAVAAGVVTLTGGTWPTWAAQGELRPGGTSTDAGITYTVNTRDSGAQLTLDDTSVTITAGATYNLYHATYDLPDAYDSFDGPITYRPGSNEWRRVAMVPWEQIRVRRGWDEVTTYPEWFAVRAKPFVSATGQRWELIFWPLADKAYHFEGSLSLNPNEPSATDIYHFGGMRLSECLLLSCLDKAEEKMNHEAAGQYHAKFLEALSSAIATDVRRSRSPSLGVEVPREDQVLRDPHYQVGNYVTYDGKVHAWQ